MGHVFRHPKYYEELRKRNRDLSELQQVKLERSVPQLDQAISLRAHDGECERAPGPGLKSQASSSKQQAIDETVPHCDIEEAASSKPQALSLDKNETQASSPKQQGSSFKPQASSSVMHEPRYK